MADHALLSKKDAIAQKAADKAQEVKRLVQEIAQRDDGENWV